MPQPDKRSALQVLTKARLRELVEAFELKLAAAESKDAHVELLARSKKATLPRLLELLLRDELKDICAAHGLDDGGREKAPLVARILGEPSAAPEPTPSPSPAPRREPTTPWRDHATLEPGQIVHVRSRQYLVNEVVPPPLPGHATLLRLSCLEDDAQGDTLEVLWEHELDARVLGRASWDRVSTRGFDRPALFSAYLHTLRWSCVTATNPNLFQAPYRAGIEVKDYQLEPLRKALAMPRVRLFIADDVGLGKTIEAGLILREMLLRQRVRRVVVACPPSVVRQWQEEMEQRFGLAFVILDRDYVAACRRERGYGVNPWTTHTRFIVSHPLLRDEAYAAPLHDCLRDEASARGGDDELAPQSLLIFDEAHNAAPASGARYAVDSHFTRAVRGIARRFEHRLFLSATPHNGHSNSFTALLEILDPDRFCRGVPPDERLLAEVMVRRLKSDLRELSPGDFPERRVVPEVLGGLPDDAPELSLSRLLQRYRDLREARLALLPRGQRAAGLLVVLALQKRLLSSIEAFACTLRVHRRAADKSTTTITDAPTDLLSQSTGADDERAELDEDEVDREAADQLERLTTHTPATNAEERALLAEMAAIADAARHRPDARVRRLIAWLTDNLCPTLGQPGARWHDRRVLLFTEYADTKRYLMQQLAAAVDGSDQAELRVGAFHGGMGDDAREKIKLAFNADPKHHPLRILVATDAAREGVNLQNHCADLFHFDVPWNPSRMEQRNGRIDRKLQRAPVVHCRYFVLPQRAEDRVLDVLVRKTATIQRELGSLSPVLERDLGNLLLAGIAHPREAELTAEIAAIEPRRKTLLDLQIERELEQVRQRQQDLKLRVTELRGLLATSRDWLNLRDDHFRGALSAALGLLGAEPLQPLDEAAARVDPERARWQVPALHRRAGADPSWATTLDALRTPRKKQQSLGEWRRDAPIRPVVFHDPGNLDGEVVHLHLEHRVVQRLLGRFLAQGFVHDQLSRACVCRSDDPEPKLLILGRLSLYGPRAARLHDEVLAIAAEWVEPDARRKKLSALPRAARDEVLANLETALATPRLREVPEAVLARLKGFAARDVADLLPQLETRARERIASAEQSLRKRGEQEAAALTQVIAGQIARIHAQIRQHDGNQQRLDFGDEAERRQLAADRRYWDTRLPELALESERAPAAIKAGYVVQAVRIEPVGVVYLWPVSA